VKKTKIVTALLLVFMAACKMPVTGIDEETGRPGSVNVAPPSNLIVTLDAAGEKILSWDAVPDAISYSLYRRVNDGPYSLIAVIPAPSLSYTDTYTLPDPADYYYKISAAKDYAGESSPSAPVLATTKSVSVPWGLKIELKSDERITVSWDQVPGAARYKVWRALSGADEDMQLMSPDPVFPVIEDTSVSGALSTPYYYKVAVVNFMGDESDPSAYISTIAQEVKTEKKDDPINVFWNPVSGAVSYKIYRTDTRGGVAEKSWASNFYSDTELDPARTYSYKISAIYPDNVEGPKTADVSCDTPPAVPEVTKIESAFDSITLFWDPIDGVTQGVFYKVYREDGSTGTYGEIASNITADSYKDTDSALTPATRYHYKVHSVYNALESATFAYAASTAPQAPVGLAKQSSSSNSITLFWPVVPGASSYKVYRFDTVENTYKEIARDIIATSYRDMGLTPATGLDPATTYSYKVSAVYNSAESVQSSACSVSTAPEAPTGVTGQANASGSITISWPAVSGASSYKVYRFDAASSAYTAIETGITLTLHTDTGLTPWTTYYYKVSAVYYVTPDDNAESLQSEICTVQARP
jgi:fibronectin type 3 domain-containing protein